MCSSEEDNKETVKGQPDLWGDLNAKKSKLYTGANYESLSTKNITGHKIVSSSKKPSGTSRDSIDGADIEAATSDNACASGTVSTGTT